MRIMVTGAAGFIGSHLCDALLADGNEVVGVDAFIDHYPRAVKEGNLAALKPQMGFRFHELDLRSDDLDSVLEGIDAVVNEAAMPGLRWDNVESYLSCNLLAVNRLIEACRRAGVHRFVQASTSSVYGANAVGDETQPIRPVSPYGVSKAAAENLLLAEVAAFDFPAIILRYFSIYGPRQRPDMAYHKFIRGLSRGEEVTVYGDGRQSRANTYVADCVAGTLAALDRGVVGGVYNIGGGESIALLDALDVIAEALAVTPIVRFEPARPGDQLHTAADTSRARNELGYQPTVGPRQGLPMQVAWQVARCDNAIR